MYSPVYEVLLRSAAILPRAGQLPRWVLVPRARRRGQGCCVVGRGRVEEEVRCGVSGPTGMTPCTHFASVGRSRSPHTTAPCACTIGLFVSIDHTSSGCSFQDDSIILTFTFFDVICPLARTVGSHLTLCTSLGPATRLVFARPFAFAGSFAFGATLGFRAASPFIFFVLPPLAAPSPVLDVRCENQLRADGALHITSPAHSRSRISRHIARNLLFFFESGLDQTLPSH